jgi:hypothetical protein
VAISNHRLLSFKDGQVAFRWKDYRDGNQKVMTLRGEEFLRRFLLHVAPKGLKRIRHQGLFAGSKRQANLALCRRLLGANSAEVSATPQTVADAPTEQQGGLVREAGRCPRCECGRLVRVAVLAQATVDAKTGASRPLQDSS